jgi:hypothetical protein
MFNVGMKRLPLTLSSAIPLHPAVDSGVKAAQLFIGRSSLVADVYGVKTYKEFVNTLEDNIREQGAMDKLISNCARAETSNRIKGILRALVISFTCSSVCLSCSQPLG